MSAVSSEILRLQMVVFILAGLTTFCSTAVIGMIITATSAANDAAWHLSEVVQF